MTTKQAVVITILIVSMITAMSFGCSFDKYARVSGGDYVPIDPGSLHDDIGVNLIKSISVDRDGQIIKIDFEDGSIIDTRFTSRPREDWPSGCPANIGSTKMEVLDLHADTLNIGSLVFNDPILVRDCPPTPEIIVLREDGPIGGSGTACAGNYSCIPFKPGTPLEPLQSPRALTDEEKDIVIQIAISSPEVESYLEQDSSFKQNSSG